MMPTRSRYFPDRRKRSKIEKLAKLAKDNSAALATEARKGSAEAAIELYRIAALTIHWLEYVNGLRPDLLAEFAQTKFSWPVMYSLHPESRKDVHNFVRELKVGAKSGINISGVGKSFSWEKPANRIAHQLRRLTELVQHASITSIQRSEVGAVDLSPLAALGVGCPSPNVHSYDDKYLEQLCALEFRGRSGGGSRLPPLSRSTADDWARETGNLFRISFGRDFEKHHRLQELKQSAVGQGKDVEASVVRSRMLKAVKQAWHSIAPLD